MGPSNAEKNKELLVEITALKLPKNICHGCRFSQIKNMPGNLTLATWSYQYYQEH
jgi:hypothetical protein